MEIDKEPPGCIPVNNKSVLMAIAIYAVNNCNDQELQRLGYELIVDLNPKTYGLLTNRLPWRAHTIRVTHPFADVLVTFAPKDQLKRLISERAKRIKMIENERRTPPHLDNSPLLTRSK